MIAWAKGNAPDLRWAVAIFVLAFVLRLLYVLWNNADPSTSATTDAWFYHHSAEAMVAGRGYIFPGHLTKAQTAYWPPGYTAVLAAVYILPGPDMIMGKLLNVILGALTCSLVFAMGRLMWSRSVGAAAGLILAFFPSHIFYSTLLLTETTFVALIACILLVFVWAWQRGRVENILFDVSLGLLVGATALVRGEGLLVPVVLGATLVGRVRFRRAARFTALVFMGVAIVLGGWTVRNIVQMNSPILINTGSSVVLSLGHWSGADGGGNQARSRYVLSYYQDERYPQREVKGAQKRTREALRYAATHPGREATLIPRRLLELYKHDHDAINWLPTDNRPLSRSTLDALRAASDVYYFAVLAASIAGAALWWRANRAFVVLLLGLVFYLSALIGLLFFGDQRYHAMLVPVFALLSAPAVLKVNEALTIGRRKPGAVAADS